MLHAFPTVKKAPERRKIWIQNINRLEPGSKNKLFTPSKDSRVCSYHFIDGKPTDKNLNPTEGLGYNFEDKQRRRNDIDKSTTRQSRRCNHERKNKRTTKRCRSTSSSDRDESSARITPDNEDLSVVHNHGDDSNCQIVSKNKLSFYQAEKIDIVPTVVNKYMSIHKLESVNIPPKMNMKNIKLSTKRLTL